MFPGQSAVIRAARRRGVVLPMLVVAIVALVGFLALAIDLGMLAVAKAQVQQGADLAALVSARTLSGTAAVNYNQAAATTNAQNVLTYNSVLGQALQPTQLQLSYGSYDYDQNTQKFIANYPITSGSTCTAVTATVTSNGLPGAFSKVFGMQILPSVSATAQAVHRPRDLALVMDLSGSMRFGTMLGYDFASNSRTTNNPDSAVPTFGHYSSSNAGMVGPSSARNSSYDNYTIPPTNTTIGNSGYTFTYINGFYQNNAYSSPLVRAFDSYTSSDGGGTWTPPTSGTPVLPSASYTSVPGGDAPLFLKGSNSAFAQSPAVK